MDPEGQHGCRLTVKSGPAPVPEQAGQQLRTLAEFLLLPGDAGSAFTAVQPIESRDAVDEEESQTRP